jgi:hypothetical protein
MSPRAVADHMYFDAEHLARGWRSAAIASGTNASFPALNRTVAIESYPEGVRLVATDSYMLLHAWVPNLDHDLDPPRELDEAPLVTAVAMDPHGRAKGFLAHLLKLATKEGADPIEVKLSLGVVSNADAAAPALEGLEARWVILEHPDHERLKLPVYDGTFPAWRALYAHFEPEKTESVGLSTEIIGRLATLGRWWPGCPLVWQFGGELRAALVDVQNAENPVTGLVMPVRWNFEHDRPQHEVDEEAAIDAEDDDQ